MEQGACMRHPWLRSQAQIALFERHFFSLSLFSYHVLLFTSPPHYHHLSIRLNPTSLADLFRTKCIGEWSNPASEKILQMIEYQNKNKFNLSQFDSDLKLKGILAGCFVVVQYKKEIQKIISSFFQLSLNCLNFYFVTRFGVGG